MQFLQAGCMQGGDAGCHKNESCSRVLSFLERLDNRTGCTHKEMVAVV